MICKKDQTTGINQRGCISTSKELNTCIRSRDLCEYCETSGSKSCNSFEFPRNRRKCIQCSSDNDDCPYQSHTGSIKKYSKYCRNTTDECISIHYGKNNRWKEACASDLTESDQNYCGTNNSLCVRCSQNNNCNLISLSTTIPPIITSTDPTEIITQKPNAAIEMKPILILLIISLIFVYCYWQ